ncbi:MAG: hypothetical protein M3Q65_07575 [Chloroflexota bacterium]|nr:hypothetical protein [Chloroflexota bacterium]
MSRACNEAGQWDIVALPGGFRVTLTMASFWPSNPWAWIDKGRAIRLPVDTPSA